MLIQRWDMQTGSRFEEIQILKQCMALEEKSAFSLYARFIHFRSNRRLIYCQLF